MIIPDVNLLVYAYDAPTPHHKKAKAWWENVLAGEEHVGLLHVVIFGFTRIVTNRRISANALSASQAAGCVRSWLQQPRIQVLYPSEEHLEQVLSSLETLGTAGNLVSDAQIAASAIAHNAVLHTADSDFARFPDLKWFNPISGASSGRVNNGRRN
jgi:toxin-antitoxin system PIN domain toxin